MFRKISKSLKKFKCLKKIDEIASKIIADKLR